MCNDYIHSFKYVTNNRNDKIFYVPGRIFTAPLGYLRSEFWTLKNETIEVVSTISPLIDRRSIIT